MAKIKYIKNELKFQRDSLGRFERYLPTLLLKKQQLQMEVRQVEARLEEKVNEERRLLEELADWRRLFAEPFDFAAHLRLREVRQTTGNIAGVNIPLLEELVFEKTTPDLLTTPPWVDDGLSVLEQLLSLRVEQDILREQMRLLGDELRVTSQRVNLFEKVKIPEARNNIRVIRIFLGDQQTAAVARSKIAKNKTLAKVMTA
ncbi:MAG: V-type ATP synthase subunit D [Lentisphaerae bacterium]|nr:V-type ATP synthase subunit D [Lentisphaerota bacterium]